MVSIPVKMILPGLNKVMRDRAVQDIVDDVGRAMEADAGPGFEYVPSPHRFGARGYVQVASGEGARRQARDAVLERVLSRRRI
ncbi:hypothetical protein [Microbacterium gilvum]|uniref:Uncharacterized protein n=1 Tax=Microbacterium gilvum TaxID=1336204 RepID=A0ABP9A692_9MICO